MLVGTNTRRYGTSRQRTVNSGGLSMGPVTLKFITITVLALLTLVYLIQSTKGSSKMVQMTDLEQKKETLESQREDLELEGIRLKTIKSLQGAAKQFNLEPVQTEEQIDEVK